MKLSIVIPAHNEEKTLEAIINKVIAIKIENTLIEIIIVNDGSKDNTYSVMQLIANKFDNIKILNNERNLGKSQTVRRGILETSGDYVVIQDADLEYDPQDIVTMFEILLSKNLDVVYGNRFGRNNKVIYWNNYIGNICLSFISNVFTYLRIYKYIPDMEVCYKMANGKVMREIAQGLESVSMFGLEPEITAKLSKYKINNNHLKFDVLPISYYPRSIDEGKHMNALRHGSLALFEIIKFNLFR